MGDDMLAHNCCHFSDAFLTCLGMDAAPRWVTNLADTGAAIRNKMQCENCCSSDPVIMSNTSKLNPSGCIAHPTKLGRDVEEAGLISPRVAPTVSLFRPKNVLPRTLPGAKLDNV